MTYKKDAPKKENIKARRANDMSCEGFTIDDLTVYPNKEWESDCLDCGEPGAGPCTCSLERTHRHFTRPKNQKPFSPIKK